jgi:putative FmdB family regulatory protein
MHNPEGTLPTYQYACTACGDRLEAVQAFTDDPLTDCPSCDGRLRKVFNSVGIVFKGSGFYRTDSRGASGSDSGEKAQAKPSAGNGSDSGSSGTTGTTGSAATSTNGSGGSGGGSAKESGGGSASGASKTTASTGGSAGTT